MKATKRPEMNSTGISTASQMLRDRIIDRGLDTVDIVGVEVAVTYLVDICHALSIRSGWWTDPKTGKAKERTGDMFGAKIALAHSELSEALEGHRKSLMDDKLLQHKMVIVELADAIIRILDIAGGFGYNTLGVAFIDKLVFNSVRPDHKLENRNKPGGKAY